MIRLALLRHGHTSWNRQGRLQGRTDIPLDEDARAHLSALCVPPAFGAHQIVSSPLQRAVETATLVAQQAPDPVPDLIEMNWGDWEGQHGAALRADPKSGYRDMEHWGWDFRPPNGEALAEVRDRLVPWVNGLQQDTLAVCHIGIMRVILAVAHGWDFLGPAPFAVKRDRLFVIDIAADAWRPLSEPIRLERRQPCA